MKQLATILLIACLLAPSAWSANPNEVVNNLFKEAQKARSQHKYDDAIQLYQRIVTEHPEREAEAQSRIADALFEKAQAAANDHKYDDAIQLYQRIEKEHPEREAYAQGGMAGALFAEAQAAVNDHKFDDAVHLYERILVELPDVAPDSWYNAQRNIAETLAKKGDLAEAAKAVHLCLDGAPNPYTFNDSIILAANILSALDKKVDRANQFLAFQQSGPAGGATNPMDSIGYPALPNREQAFETMLKQAGDTPAASRLRAYTFLFTGKPKEALPQFADEFRRSSDFRDLQQASLDLIVGLRAARGQNLDLDKAIQFVLYGPNGPDGKPKTPDDLADPFAELLPAPPPAGDGGLAELSADDLASLRKVRDACLLYAGDPWVDGNLRYHSFAVLQRINIALDNWGATGQKDWYLEHAFEFNNLNDIIPSMLAAARDRELNFGGVYPLLNEIDARIAAQKDSPPTNGIEKARTQFDAMCAEIKKQSTTKIPPIKPLTQPATSF